MMADRFGGFYAGVQPESAIPASAVGTEFDHSEIHGQRTVKYYKCYMPYPQHDHLANLPMPLADKDRLYSETTLEEYDRIFNRDKKIQYLPYDGD